MTCITACHFHGIIEINLVGADSISAQNEDTKRAEIDSAPTVNSQTNSITNTNANLVDIPRIIQSFKRYTTIEYIKMVK